MKRMSLVQHLVVYESQPWRPSLVSLLASVDGNQLEQSLQSDHRSLWLVSMVESC